MKEKLWNKIRNKNGFTLTEVMIGMMILTVAIVSATNLLVGLIGMNKLNVNALKAYYLAQEGIEAVRNIRDSNWLHNRNWLTGTTWGVSKLENGSYTLVLNEAWNDRAVIDEGTPAEDAMRISSPWTLKSESDMALAKIYKSEQGYLSASGGEETNFSRLVEVSLYEDCEACVLVKSTVQWSEDSDDQVTLQTILTNWKGGVF